MIEKKEVGWHETFESFTPRRRFALESRSRKAVGQMITVASQKGGVGKTTSCVNLAAGVGLAGHKSLLFDFDPQSNATSGVGERRIANELLSATRARHEATSANRSATPRPFLAALQEPDFFLTSVRETQFENLWVLPSFQAYSEVATVQALLSTSFDLWKKQVRSLREHFDFIFVDCPPSLGGIPTLALSASDRVLVPIQCEYYAMEGLSQILPVVDDLQRNGGQGSGEGRLRIGGLVLTMYDDALELSRDVVGEIREYFPDLVCRTIIPRDVTLAEAASHGLPVFYYSPQSRGAWSYLDLTREVLSHEQP
jgi:chromosome partitioning protein